MNRNYIPFNITGISGQNRYAIEQKKDSEGVTYPEKMIPFAIDREGGAQALKQMVRDSLAIIKTDKMRLSRPLFLEVSCSAQQEARRQV